MPRRAHSWTAILISVALTGCATLRPVPPPAATGEASWRAVPAPGMTRYQLALGDVSSGAEPFLRVAPIYPPDLLASCPAPVDVEALLIVDQAGKVGEVRMADAPRNDTARRQFIDAVRAAARQWQFSPLQISHWAADADGNSHVVDSETKPFSLAYVFRFACHAGKPTVSSGVAQS
jgi:hypothetical protein